MSQNLPVPLEQPLKALPAPLQTTARVVPFGVLSETIEVPHGGTVVDMLISMGVDPTYTQCEVYINSRYCARQFWDLVRPAPGATVAVNIVPMGGGGSKSPLRLLASVAIAVAVPAIAPALGITSTLGVTLLKAGLNLAVGALFGGVSAPPTGGLTTRRPRAESPVFSITGIRNQTTPYGVIPNLYGVQRMYPVNAVKQFTEISGDDQFLNAVFAFGYGPILFSDFRIGESPLDNFDDVEIEVRSGYPDDDPITLYHNQVNTQSLGVLVDKASGPHFFETEDGTDEAILDFAFTQGLIQFNENGGRDAVSATYNISYRLAGSSDPYSTAGVKGTDNIDSTGVTLESSGVNTFTYSLDDVTAEASSVLTLGTLTPDGTNDTYTYRIGVREVGQTNFAQVVNVLAAQQPDDSNGTFYGQQFSLSDEIAVQVPIPIGKNVEFQVTTLTQEGDATTEAPIFVSYTYRAAATAGDVKFSGATIQLALRSARIRFPTRNRWEIRIERLTDDNANSTTIRRQAQLSQIKSITNEEPLRGLTCQAMVAVRIKATGQLAGVLDRFSAIASRLIPKYETGAWTDPVETNNPAWCYADVFRGKANLKPISDSLFDTATLEEWAADNDTVGFTFNHIFDSRQTVYEAAQMIASVGFASPTFKDGTLFSVVINKVKTTPVQHISPRNAANLQGEKIFLDQPHALKVRFRAAVSNYETDEVIVYDDGRDETNSTEFQVLELPGVDNFPQAFRMARRYLATLRLRPETFSVSVDIENLIATRGDLVKVVYDSIAVGIGQARIKSLVTDGGGNVTSIAVDDELIAEAGSTYAIRIRRASDNGTYLTTISDAPGNLTTVTPSTAIPAAEAPAVGDLLLFGVSGSESADMVITRVQPRSDLSALLSMQDAAPGIFDADDDAIPPFNPNITLPPNPIELRPPEPVIQSVLSDESVLLIAGDGSFDPRVVVTFALQEGDNTPVDHIQAEFRITGDDQFTPLVNLPPGSTTLIINDVQQGEVIDIRIRTVDEFGETSDYALVESHTVTGASNPPASPENVRKENDLMRWDYPSPPIDFEGFKIRHRSGSLVQTTGADEIPGFTTTTEFDLTTLPVGIRTVMVSAVDLAGNESDPGFIILNLGSPDITNIVFTFEEDANNFPGTVTGGSRVSLELHADAGGTAYLPAANALYLPDGDALYLPVSYGEMVYETEFAPPYGYDTSFLLLDIDTEGDGFTIEYHGLGDGLYLPVGSDPYLGADGDTYLEETPGYSQWPGFVDAGRQKYMFRITLAAGNTQGKITNFDFLVDVPDIIEQLNDIAIAATGTRLPITNTYNQIKFVSMTIQSINGEDAVALRIEDKDPDLGPLILAFDDSNAATTATIDAEVRGF